MKDLLPGTELFIEDRPLLFVNKEYLNRFDNQGRIGVFTAAYNTYSRRLPPKMRWKFMQLHGPTEGPFPDSIRVLAKEMMTWENDEKRPFNEKEVNNFVKVASIWRYNAFAVSADNTMAVYETASRMNHSCRPNSALEFNGLRCVCRVIAPVAKAEELTVEYNPLYRFRPTHDRRHVYLEKKDFTCHCPRCAAPGDDTRQFRCTDPSCPGVMHMCQPLNTEPFQAEGVNYSDVEYSDPRLLPCTVCGATASAEQTQDQLAAETALADFVYQLEGRLAEEGFDRFSAAECAEVLRSIEERLTQPRHALSGPLYRHHWQVSQYRARLTGRPEQLWASTVRFLAWLNHLHSFPSAQLLATLTELASGLVDAKWAPALPAARDLCKRALRLSLLLRGREDQRMELDRLLAVVDMRLAATPPSADTAAGQQALALALEPLPIADPALFTGCLPPRADPGAGRRCEHCEESPARVALTLSRCARCKVALYCGPACQRAHWKAHRACCTPAAPATPKLPEAEASADDHLTAVAAPGDSPGACAAKADLVEGPGLTSDDAGCSA